MQAEIRRRLAILTSNILNPFLVSLIMVIIISLKTTTSFFEALKWSSIALALSILPVLSVMVYLIRKEKLEGISIRVRKQRHRIYLLATICAVVSCVVLFRWGAPLMLVASFAAGLSAIVIFMCINFLWKISVHTAFVTSSVTLLIILFGPIGAVSTVLLPLIGWSRIELEHHSPAQVAIGALLAALIIVVVFHFFGIIGTSSC